MSVFFIRIFLDFRGFKVVRVFKVINDPKVLNDLKETVIRRNQRAASRILAVTRRLKSEASIRASAVRCMR